MPAAPIRTAFVALVALAASLTGCGAPEGAGSIDADAARQALVARGRPDPLAPAGQSIAQVKPTAPRRAVARRR